MRRTDSLAVADELGRRPLRPPSPLEAARRPPKGQPPLGPPSFRRPAPSHRCLGPPATCHLTSVQKTVLTLEIPRVLGAVRPELDKDQIFIFYGASQGRHGKPQSVSGAVLRCWETVTLGSGGEGEGDEVYVTCVCRGKLFQSLKQVVLVKMKDS